MCRALRTHGSMESAQERPRRNVHLMQPRVRAVHNPQKSKTLSLAGAPGQVAIVLQHQRLRSEERKSLQLVCAAFTHTHPSQRKEWCSLVCYCSISHTACFCDRILEANRMSEAEPQPRQECGYSLDLCFQRGARLLRPCLSLCPLSRLERIPTLKKILSGMVPQNSKVATP